MVDVVHLVSPYRYQRSAKIKSQALLLAPFFNFIIIYFAFVREPVGDIWTTLMKCAPIMALMMYIVLKGFTVAENYKCSWCILFGLIFSCVGDVLLNINLFPYGMAAFGVAHIFYIPAFGWQPLKLLIGVPLYVLGIALYAVFFKRLDPILVVGMPIYAALLLTMCWRALAKATHKKDFFSVFCGIGSVLFVISDGLIAVNMFVTSIPHARFYIMSTYYFAQFAIALSTVTENDKASDTQLGKSNCNSGQVIDNTSRHMD